MNLNNRHLQRKNVFAIDRIGRLTPTTTDPQVFAVAQVLSFLKRLASERNFLALVGYARKRWIPTPLAAGRTRLIQGDRLSGLNTASF